MSFAWETLQGSILDSIIVSITIIIILILIIIIIKYVHTSKIKVKNKSAKRHGVLTVNTDHKQFFLTFTNHFYIYCLTSNPLMTLRQSKWKNNITVAAVEKTGQKKEKHLVSSQLTGDVGNTDVNCQSAEYHSRCLISSTSSTTGN